MDVNERRRLDNDYSESNERREMIMWKKLWINEDLLLQIWRETWRRWWLCNIEEIIDEKD